MKNKDNFKTLFPFILAAVLGLGVVLIYLPVLLNLVNRLAGDENYWYWCTATPPPLSPPPWRPSI